MGTIESNRGRRERSPKQEYLDQVLKCVSMRRGRGGLYRRGGASGSTNLDVVKSFNERQLLVNSQPLILCFNALNSNTSHRTCTSHLRTRTAPHRPSGRPRLASPTPTASARRGERARVRLVHRPPLTGFTSGVHEVHLLSRLRSFSIPGTELNIDSLALIVGFKFF